MSAPVEQRGVERGQLLLPLDGSPESQGEQQRDDN